MKTFILPAAPWAVLLDGIVRNAPPGSVLSCGTPDMRDLALEAVKAAGREDITVTMDERKERAVEHTQ